LPHTTYGLQMIRPIGLEWIVAILITYGPDVALTNINFIAD